MAKPLDTQTNKQLEEALAEGDLSERKAAVAEEILRRRHDTKSGALREKHGWFGVVLAAFSWAILSLKRIWRKKPRN
jgi:hypothetical protein